MNDIPEYLSWRGDIPFSQVPMNEVDAYVLAKIGVPDLNGLVGEEGEPVPLKDAYRAYFGRKDIDPDYFGRLNQTILSKTLRRLPDTVRFGDLPLSDYLQKESEVMTEQFSALTIALPDGPTVVTFRGTDDTIVGWKENFLMAARDVVPAQKDALDYLVRMAARHPGPLVVIGHSKGGNLSVFAAVMAPAEIQDRIEAVYNFDGPGFRNEFWLQPGVPRVRNRIRSYVSQHTMVGTLLTQSEELVICRSKRTGPVAHEAMYWDVMGPGFVRAKKLSALSVEFDRLLDLKMQGMSREEIERFVEDFFGILTSTGASTLTDLARLSPEQLRRVVREMGSTESVKEFGKEFAELLARDTGRLPEKLMQLRGRLRERQRE